MEEAVIVYPSSAQTTNLPSAYMDLAILKLQEEQAELLLFHGTIRMQGIESQ